MTVLRSPLPGVGRGLNRPESVITLADGRVYACDRLCGVVRVLPTQSEAVPLKLPVEPFIPNGIALLEDGSFLIANMGPTGGVWRLTGPGRIEPFIVDLHGRALHPTNYVDLDAQGRLWFTVSTTIAPREAAFRPGIADGYVVRHEDGRSEVVAEHIGFCNEGRISPDGAWYYINETIARRVTRFPVLPDGQLGVRETVIQFGRDGIFPDGMGFDDDGGVWVASVVSNRLVRIKDGKPEIIVEDCDEAVVEGVEDAFFAGRMGRSEIDAGRTWSLGNISSVAFGGADLKTIYLGSLFRESLTVLTSAYTGAVPVHWRFGKTVLD
jgi:sugar lactone lactonase YvrE